MDIPPNSIEVSTTSVKTALRGLKPAENKGNFGVWLLWSVTYSGTGSGWLVARAVSLALMARKLRSMGRE